MLLPFHHDLDPQSISIPILIPVPVPVLVLVLVPDSLCLSDNRRRAPSTTDIELLPKVGCPTMDVLQPPSQIPTSTPRRRETLVSLPERFLIWWLASHGDAYFPPEPTAAQANNPFGLPALAPDPDHHGCFSVQFWSALSRRDPVLFPTSTSPCCVRGPGCQRTSPTDLASHACELAHSANPPGWFTPCCSQYCCSPCFRTTFETGLFKHVWRWQTL